MQTKINKLIEEKKIKAWAKIPDCSCLGEPLQIYSSKKEAKNAINNMEARLYGVNCLYKDFKPNFISKVIPITITYFQKKKQND